MRYKRRLFRICAVSLFFTIACIAQGNAAEKLAPHSNLVVGDCNLWHNSFFLGEKTGKDLCHSEIIITFAA